KTFSQAALDFTDRHLRRKVRRWQASARLLGVTVGADGALQIMPKGLADRWRDRPVTAISGDDIHHVIEEARERGVPGLQRRSDKPSEAMARIMFTTLAGLFSWLLEKRRITANPMTNVTAPETGDARERVLTDDEIKKFWQATETTGEPVAQVLKLLL